VAVLTIDQNPTTSDTIVFTLKTPDANGCFNSDPYKVNQVVIYYVERDFTSNNFGSYEQKKYDKEKLKSLEEAEALMCSSPTEENIQEVLKYRKELESSAITSEFYFNESKPIHVVGNEVNPAWLSTDTENALIDHIVLDSNLNSIYGNFEYKWSPKSQREGDYFICWTWTPLIAGDSLSSHIKFSLFGDTQETTSIPTHYTNPTKYETLLERYLPEMYKMNIKNGDLTPDVLDRLNKSIALGFNTLEDLGNQLVDLQDANSLHEALIPYLSNYFGLKLKTDDPTKWRAQIKRAIPVYKSKGTKRGLIEALDLAAIKLISYTQFWEVVSPYTWQESFVYSSIDGYCFELEKMALPIDLENFELWLRPSNNDEWMLLDSDYVDFTTVDGTTTMCWVGYGLSSNSMDLIDGDEIRILYKYRELPDANAQIIENYIRSLPLMDQRESRNQIYPLKNWNVRLIEEKDPMFDLIVPVRHPFHDPVIYGKIRTEFAYSENIYNMDEYNGSIRNSNRPCDIDRFFIDKCSSCISSCYGVDLEIERLCDDRIIEAKEVLREYTPFHAVLFNLNFVGKTNEFIQPPLEEINYLISIKNQDFVISGEAQNYFTRNMILQNNNAIYRDQLAQENLVLSSVPGIAYNENIMLFAPNVELDKIGIALDGSSKLEILSPSLLSGIYDINSPKNKTAVVDLTSGVPNPVAEPIDNCNNLFDVGMTLNSCTFAFNIKNVLLDGESLCSVEKDFIYLFEDSQQDFITMGVKSEFDVEQGNAPYSWKILIPTYDGVIPYDIKNILPNGKLEIVNHGSTLPLLNSLGLNYTLMDGVQSIVSSNGNLFANPRARVTVLNSSLTPIKNILDRRICYFYDYSLEYLITGFVEGTDDQFYISNYSGPDLGPSTNLIIYQRLATQEVGYFSHQGLKLQIPGNLEASLGIQNGDNSLVVVDDGIENNRFKENFIVEINDDKYFISQINGDMPSGYTTITLSGNDHYWKKLNSGGTSVNANFYQFDKLEATIIGQTHSDAEHTFRTIDRSGRFVTTETNQNGVVTGLSENSGKDQFSDFVNQNENVGIIIEYEDGTIEKGNI
jgi:hypothetical protein